MIPLSFICNDCEQEIDPYKNPARANNEFLCEKCFFKRYHIDVAKQTQDDIPRYEQD